LARDQRMAAICAFETVKATSRIDVNRTLRVLALEAAVARKPAVRLANVAGIHSSASPALRRPSNSGGMFTEWVCCHLRVSSELRRRASAKADVASSILPSSA
jgi:hypothetical protein